MAPKTGDTPQNLLHFNCIALSKLEKPSHNIKEYLKVGIFSKPNRVAFENIMYFLINAYDPQLCRSVISAWPIIERKTQERVYRREIVTAFAKIASEESDFGLPPLSQSFLSSPGGERLETFLWKFSALCLRTVLQRRNTPHVLNPPQGLRASKCIALAESRKRGAKAELAQSLGTNVALTKGCAEDARFLSDTLRSNTLAIMESRKVLSDLGIEESSLEDLDISKLFAEVEERVQGLRQSLEVIENQEKTVAECASVARVAMDQQRIISVVEGSGDVAQLMNRTRVAVEEISIRFGRPTDPRVLSRLVELREELLAVSQLMDNNLKSVVKFAVAASSQAAECADAGTPITQRFVHARQLLRDASQTTPLLTFLPTSSTLQTISADTGSPPISSVAKMVCAPKHNGTPLRKVPARSLPLLPQKMHSEPSQMFTPARLRSEIPVRISSKDSKTSLGKLAETAPKTASMTQRLPKTPTETAPFSAQPSKVFIGEDTFGFPRVGDLNEEDSAQKVLDLAVSVLTPVGTSSLTSDPAPKRSPLIVSVDEDVSEAAKSSKQVSSSQFAECMTDSPLKTVYVSDVEAADKKTNKTVRRRSILDLIERYKGIVPAAGSEPAVGVAEEDEWKESDVEISFDSDHENNAVDNGNNAHIRFALSPGF